MSGSLGAYERAMVVLVGSWVESYDDVLVIRRLLDRGVPPEVVAAVESRYANISALDPRLGDPSFDLRHSPDLLELASIFRTGLLEAVRARVDIGRASGPEQAMWNDLRRLVDGGYLRRPFIDHPCFRAPA